MTQTFDVLSYINEKHRPLSGVQCQNWLYYVQACSLAWDGTPIG